MIPSLLQIIAPSLAPLLSPWLPLAGTALGWLLAAMFGVSVLFVLFVALPLYLRRR